VTLKTGRQAEGQARAADMRVLGGEDEGYGYGGSEGELAGSVDRLESVGRRGKAAVDGFSTCCRSGGRVSRQKAKAEQRQSKGKRQKADARNDAPGWQTTRTQT
jgi:GTPase